MAAVHRIGCRVLAHPGRHRLDVSTVSTRCRLHARRGRHGFQQERLRRGELSSDRDHRAGPDTGTQSGTRADADADADDNHNADYDYTHPDDDDHAHDAFAAGAASGRHGFVYWGFRDG
jgi:hypothetical protein